MMTAFKDKYIDILKTYYFVGGMPAAVKALAESGNLKSVRRIQMVWDGIPSQLAKENKKFIYSVLREGARVMFSLIFIRAMHII